MARHKTVFMSLIFVFMLVLGFSLYPQPHLQATPESSGALWVGTSNGIEKFALSDLSRLFEASNLGETRALAVDDWNARVWAFTGNKLYAFGFGGERLLSVSVPGENGNGRHVHDDRKCERDGAKILIVDSADGAVWLTTGKTVHRYSIQGDLEVSRSFPYSIQSIALDLLQSRLWVATDQALTAHDRNGNEVASISLGKSSDIREISIEPSSGDLWVASEHALRRYDTSGSILFEKPFPKICRMVGDGHNGLWAVGQDFVWHLNGSGKALLATRHFMKWGGGDPVALALDPKDSSLWIINEKSVAHLSDEGKIFETRLKGKTHKRLLALAVYRDVQPPTLRITSPLQGSAVASGTPEIRLAFSDTGTGVDTDSLEIKANGNKIDMACTFTEDTGICTPALPFPEGVNTLTATIKDFEGNAFESESVSFSVDTKPPVVTLSSPANGLITNKPSIPFTGSAGDAISITINGALIPLGADGGFSSVYSLTEGENTLQFLATDKAGNTGTLTVQVNLDIIPPAVPVLALIHLGDLVNDQVTLTGDSGSVDAGAQVTLTNLITGETRSTIAGSDGSFTLSIGTAPGQNLSLVVIDAAGNTGGAATVSIPKPLLPAAENIPEGSFADTYRDLVPQNATVTEYNIKRFGLVTGLVHGIEEQPLAEVIVSVHDHPEYGSTVTNPEGRFTIPVEGGGTLTLVFQKEGLITSHRQVYVPWNEIAIVESLRMIPEDSAATVVTFDGNASTIMTHRSTEVADTAGKRSCTLVFSGDNRAYALDTQGNVTGELTTLTTRATEFKTPESMPAKLPPNSAYTYCSELKVDGVERVRFEKPVIMWVDNFLGFPVGQAVPVGYYDRDQGVWVPADNGRVVRLLDTDANGVVDAVDGNGDGRPDDLNGNGHYDDEAVGLADSSRYVPGAAFWRVAVTHFTPWDCNWPYGPPADAVPPNASALPDTDQQMSEAKSCELPINSFVEERSRIFHDDIPVPGTGMTLHYASNRVSGYQQVLTIPASGASIPASLKQIIVKADLAGRTFSKVLAPLPNQKVEFLWDGLNWRGQKVSGAVTAHIQVGFVYQAVYLSPGNFNRAFGQAGGSVTGDRSRQEVISWRRYDVTVDPGRGSTSIAEGWSLSPHHALNPSDSHSLYRGDGSMATSSAQVLQTLAGTGAWGFGGDGGPATQATLNWPFRLTAHPSGDIYVADVRNNRIRKIDTDGVISTVAGGGSPCGSDGAPAVNACLSEPQKVAFDRSGNMYIANTGAGNIKKLDTNGIITTVVSGLSWPDSIAADPLGNLYVAEQYANRVRKIDPDGVMTTIVSGGFNNVTDVALDPSGNLYVADRYGCRVAKLDTSGKMTTVAGTGSCGYGGDGGPATSARLGNVYGIAVDAGGSLLIGDYSNARVRKVDSRGTITTVAGNGTWAAGTEGQPATRTSLYGAFGVAVDASGIIYVTEPDAPRIRKISAPARFGGALLSGEIPFAEENGLGHIFSSTGNHIKTADLDTGIPLRTFGYDEQDRLTSITDRFGNVTVVERDANGVATAIASPDGIRTELTIDGKGHLTKITYADTTHTNFEYSPDGLLTAKIEPQGNRYTHTFDSKGRLTNASDEEGGNWHYTHSRNGAGETLIERTTAEGNQTTYLDRTDSAGVYTSRITDPAGGETVYTSSADELTVKKTLSCGMTLDFQYGLDPEYRFNIARQTVETAPSNLKRTTAFDRIYQDTNGDKVPDRITEKETVNGKMTTQVKDTLQATNTVTTPQGRTTGSTYDPETLLTTSVSLPGLFDTHFTYDERGRLTKVVVNNRETGFDYDERGNVSSVTDPEHRVTSYSYDAVGRVTAVVRPDETSLGFTYDDNGNMQVLTTPSAVGHGFGFNRVNLNDSYDAPLSGSYAYTYDRDRRLKSILFPSGKTIENLYDTIRLDKTITPEGEIDYRYLCASKVGSITMGTEQVSYGYDGSLVTSETLAGTLNTIVGFTYNNDFQVSRLSYAGGFLDLGYDNDGLLTRAGAFTITRNPANGLPVSLSGGSLTRLRTFNGYGEMDGEVFTVSGSEPHSWSVSRTEAGRIHSKTETINGVSTELTYEYDVLGRLHTVTKDGSIVEEYRYDTNGNRTFERNLLRGIAGRTFAYSEEDHLLVAGDTAYEYDVDGLLTTKTQGGQVTGYRYSSRGELLSVTLPSGRLIEYVHDPLGRRIAKWVDGSITEKYLWQGITRLLAVYDGSNNLLLRFHYADARMPVAVTQGAVTYSLTFDPVGSLRTVVDATGNIVKRLDYDAFGNRLFDSNSSFAVPLGFAGGLADADTGLVRFGFRDYDPNTGRWTAKDPIYFAGGDTNLYGYVLNDPVNLVDPKGLNPTAGGAVVGGAIGGPSGAIIGGIIGSIAGATIGEWIWDNWMDMGDRPPGFWPGDKGADEWGRRNGVGAKEGRRRFHKGVKQKCSGSKANDDYSVNPDTGDVVDPNGEIIGNLEDVRAK